MLKMVFFKFYGLKVFIFISSNFSSSLNFMSYLMMSCLRFSHCGFLVYLRNPGDFSIFFYVLTISPRVFILSAILPHN